MPEPKETETIPRLHQLVAHMSDFLTRMGDGLTFEEVRRGYADSVAKLELRGLGRRTASRVSDADAYWSPTVELLEEAMRLGFVVRRPLPSARAHLEAHRNVRHELTPEGRLAADMASRAAGRFRLLLADAALTAHPYLRALVELLADAPLICPEVREGAVELGRRESRDTASWARWAAAHVAGTSADDRTAELVLREIKLTIGRRFGGSDAPPTSKALAEALNDAFAAASLKLRGLSVGATDLKVLKAWGSQLLLLDQSRYVPAHPDCNVIWLASDLSRTASPVSASPRTFEDHGAEVARAVLDAYRQQGRAHATEMITMPYLPIHEVRAEAAFECRVARSLVDIVLEKLSTGAFPELGAQVWLHLSGGEVPSSEPVYRRGGTRRFSMTITTQTEEAS